MTSYSRQAIFVGLTITFAVVLAELFGLLEAVERAAAGGGGPQ